MIVVWRVTERCNLACGFCAYDRRVERSRRDADPDAVLAFGAVLAEYQRAAADPVLVSWLGGEPLLWSPLERLTTAFVREFGLRVSVTTNGTALASAKVRAHVLDCYSEVTVSVDALGEAHDRVRGWRGGFAQLRRVVPQLAAARRPERFPRLRANVVLMCDNVASSWRRGASTRSPSISSAATTVRSSGPSTGSRLTTSIDCRMSCRRSGARSPNAASRCEAATVTSSGYVARPWAGVSPCATAARASDSSS